MAKTHVSKKKFVQKVAGRAMAEGQNSNILTKYLSRWHQIKKKDLSFQKPFERKFATLAARADFESLFFVKNNLLMTFWQEIISPHSQGV